MPNAGAFQMRKNIIMLSGESTVMPTHLPVCASKTGLLALVRPKEPAAAKVKVRSRRVLTRETPTPMAYPARLGHHSDGEDFLAELGRGDVAGLKNGGIDGFIELDESEVMVARAAEEFGGDRGEVLAWQAHLDFLEPFLGKGFRKSGSRK